MLKSRPNGCRRLGRPLKRLLDETKIGLSRSNSWWMKMMIMMMMMSNAGLHKTQSMQAREHTPCRYYRAPCDAHVFWKHKIGISRWEVFTAVLMKILVFWDGMSHWLIPVDNYITVDMASNPRRLISSTHKAFLWMQKSHYHSKIKIGIYVIYMCLSGRKRFKFTKIMSRKIKCFWSTLVGALHGLNDQPSSLIKKTNLLPKLYPNFWKELINEYSLKYSTEFNHWLKISFLNNTFVCCRGPDNSIPAQLLL